MPRWHVEGTDSKTVHDCRDRRGRLRQLDDVTLRFMTIKAKRGCTRASRGRGRAAIWGRISRNVLELFHGSKKAGIAEPRKQNERSFR